MRAFYNIVFTVLILTSCKTKPTFEAKNQNIVTSQKPNVLLLYMDDLRPEIGAYGSKIVQTPHIDALAKEGLKFTEAYSNVSVCGASRASMLTGIRPTRTQFLNYNTFVEKEQPDAISLPLLFKQNGYNVISNGKIYHHLDDNNTDFDEVYRPYAFDKNDDNLAPTDYWQSLWKDYQTPEHRAEYKQTNTGPAYEMSEV
jgi:iduronate 2-sulfatase